MSYMYCAMHVVCYDIYIEALSYVSEVLSCIRQVLSYVREVLTYVTVPLNLNFVLLL